MKKAINKRNTTFFNSDPGISSERARIIFSNPKDAKNAIKAIRARLRGGKDDEKDLTFKLTEETEKRLEKAES